MGDRRRDSRRSVEGGDPWRVRRCGPTRIPRHQGAPRGHKPAHRVHAIREGEVQEALARGISRGSSAHCGDVSRHQWLRPDDRGRTRAGRGRDQGATRTVRGGRACLKPVVSESRHESLASRVFLAGRFDRARGVFPSQQSEPVDLATRRPGLAADLDRSGLVVDPPPSPHLIAEG